MQVNGIDLAGLAEDAGQIAIPEPVQGRVVHIDADFLAYQVTAQRADGTDVKTFDDMKHNAGIAVQMLKSLAAATAVHLHLTPSSSDKGGRFEQALLKEYQGNREDKVKPQYLNIMREHLSKAYPATMHQLCEADDGMSSSQYAAMAAGQRHLSIIASKDKDLNMVPGLHLDWDTGVITDTASDFGEIHMRVTPSGAKKLTGYGQKFFWAQMLTGDTADNISGLPKLVGPLLNNVKPTQEITKATGILLTHPAGSVQHNKALDVLRNRKAGQVGPVLAELCLDEYDTNIKCFEYVKTCFRMYGEEFGFQNYRDGTPVTWGAAFASEAKLLWMRREKHNRNDVLNWLREIATNA